MNPRVRRHHPRRFVFRVEDLDRSLDLDRIFHKAEPLDPFAVGASQVFPADGLVGGFAFCCFGSVQIFNRLNIMYKTSRDNGVFYTGEQATFTHSWIHGAIKSGLGARSKSGM